MSVRQHIPNFLTSMNLFCGAVATFLAVQGVVDVAAWLIFAGALFDFSDGFAARALKAYSEIGKELDSLADLVTFGVAPSAIYSAYIKFFLTGSFFTPWAHLNGLQAAWVLAPFILAVFAALRLAKFNLDTRQNENFLGLTTTATGIFTASWGAMVVQNPEYFSWLRPSYVLILIMIFCMLLVSEVPMFSLKFKGFRVKGNEDRYALLLIALLSLALLGVGGIALTILFYIGFALARWVIKGNQPDGMVQD